MKLAVKATERENQRLAEFSNVVNLGIKKL